MTAVRATFDIRDLEVGVRRAVRDDMPFIVAASLTKTAKRAQDDVKAQMPLIFDRPTRWTLNSTAIRPATKRQPEAAVFMKTGTHASRAAGIYLVPQVFGTRRSAKGLEVAMRGRGLLTAGEFLVPAKGVRLNQYGNLSRSLVQRIVAQVRAGTRASTAGTGRGKRSGRSSAGAVYFWSDGTTGLPKGVAERRGKRVKMIVIAVSAPDYGRRFPMVEIVRQSAARHGPDIFRGVATGVFAKLHRP